MVIAVIADITNPIEVYRKTTFSCQTLQQVSVYFKVI